MQKYKWKDNQVSLSKDHLNELHLMINSNDESLPYLPSQTSRTLVDISTNLLNNNSTIYLLFQSKLDQYIAILQSTDLSSSEIW